MDKVILVSNKLYKYRAQVYSDFIKLFSEKGYDFKVVIAVDSNEERFGLPSKNIHFVGSSFKRLKSYLYKEKPCVIINFLHPTDKSIWYVYFYAFFNKVPNIYWNHGVNLQDPNNKIKLFVYRILHKLSDAIILYSKNELRFIVKSHHKKTFVANNTINFKNIPKINSSIKQLKLKHRIKFKKNVLFVGRIQKRKRLDVIIKIFKREDFKNFGLLIVGPGFTKKYRDLVGNSNNIFYLGAIYDNLRINEIFKLSDLFCIPGTNGLGVNQAMFWGLPCLALGVKHSPEIIYVEQNKTGFILKDEDQLADCMKLILNDEELLKEFGNNALKKIKKEASIELMFKGFLDAVEYCSISK